MHFLLGVNSYLVFILLLHNFSSGSRTYSTIFQKLRILVTKIVTLSTMTLRLTSSRERTFPNFSKYWNLYFLSKLRLRYYERH